MSGLLQTVRRHQWTVLAVLAAIAVAFWAVTMATQPIATVDLAFGAVITCGIGLIDLARKKAR